MIEDLKGRETWRIFRIMSEFVEGFEELSDIGLAVTIFGSVRFHRNHKYYKKAVEISGLLTKNGYTIDTCGKGILEWAYTLDKGNHAKRKDNIERGFRTD